MSNEAKHGDQAGDQPDRAAYTINVTVNGIEDVERLTAAVTAAVDASRPPVDLDAPEHAICSAALAARNREIKVAREENSARLSEYRNVLVGIAYDWDCDADREGFHRKDCRKCAASKAIGRPVTR